MRKIAIIGRGTVGCTAAAYFAALSNLSEHNKDLTVDWYYDPEIKPTPVGEGTTLVIPKVWGMTDLIPQSDFMLPLRSTTKIGIMKRNWGTDGKQFLHPFPMGNVGLHFSGVTFQDVAFERLKSHPNITCIERNVEPEDVDADYVYCCTGTPRDFGDSFIEAEGIPVNAAYVFQCPWDGPRFDYSITYAMPNGWVFGIPLRDRCSIGYVHNNKFATPEQIEQELQPLFQELNLTPATGNYLNFRNYYRKQMITDRIAYNGNAGFFLEPLEATSTSTACQHMATVSDLWFKTDRMHAVLQARLADVPYVTNAEVANDLMINELKNIEAMIAMHYASGSVHKTDFWKYAQQVGRDRLEAGCKDKEMFLNNLLKTHKYKPSLSTLSSTILVSAGTWDAAYSYALHAKKLGLDNILTDLNSRYTLDQHSYDWEPDRWEVVA